MDLFLDGMGHYDDDQIDEKYTVVSRGDPSPIATFTITPEGRFANCLRKDVTGGLFTSSGYVEKTMLMTQSGPWTPTNSGVMGFALTCDNLSQLRIPGNHHLDTIVEIYESISPILFITLDTSGTLSLYKRIAGFVGDANQYLATSIEGLRSGIYSHVQIKWTIALAGSVQIKVNNVLVLNYSGDTRASSFVYPYSNVWNTARWLNMGSQSSNTFKMCDLWVFDQAGSFNNDFIGDKSIDYITTNGVGAANGFTSSTGDANWMNVDEVPPDCGTSYNFVTATGTRDSFAMQNVPAGTTPIAFQAIYQVKKATQGQADLKFSFRPPGGPYYDSQAQGITTVSDCRYIIQPYDTNPHTGTTITEAEINAAEFGYQKA